MERPNSLFVVPIEGMEDDDKLDSVLVKNLKPGPGALCILLPEAGRGHRPAAVDGVYRVLSRVPTEVHGWDWDLEVEYIPAPANPTWFDIVDGLIQEGLVALSIAPGEGLQITHLPTIEFIWGLLGWG